MLRLLCLLTCVALCTGDAVNVNEMIDQLLDGLRTKFRDEGKDTLPIDDIEGSKTWKKAFIRFTGKVHCKNGWVGYLTSIRRTGDAVMSTEGNTITIKLSLGIDDLHAKFEKCQLKASKLFSITHPVEASSHVAISAQISLIREGEKCTTRFDHANVDDMGRIKLKTGGNILHKLEDLVLNLITRLMHGNIKNSLNNTLVSHIKQAVESSDLCDKIPL